MKNNKTILIVIGLIFVSAIAGMFLFFRNKNSSKVVLKNYTLSDISTHNSASDCWTTINGGVYDVTKFISQHRGGDRILSACGVDATDLFTGKSPLGRIHSAMAQKLLSSMQIGTLQK
jgi:cytochrome b involved in lipid metabolism